MKLKRRALLSLIAALPLTLITQTGCGRNSANTARPTATPEVSVTPVVRQDVPISGEWVATLEGYVNAQIQPQVSGYLVRQTYQEGSAVRAGQVLFEIDPRPFEAALEQARGQLAVAKGQLAQAEGQLAQSKAQFDLAKINVERDTPLAKKRAIAQSQLDTEIQAQKTAEANIVTSQASIQTAHASIQAAEAAVKTGLLNLEFTKVRSLVDGIAGTAAVQIGNLVGPSTVLTTVSKVDPIKVYFPISEQEYLKVSGLSKGGHGDGWLKKKSSVPLTLTLSDGTVYPHKGHIIFTDREVNAQTGTIRIVAAFPNPGAILRPGQFGRVGAVKELAHGALLVPQRAVANSQGQYQVAVVGADNRVDIRNVTVGVRAGTMWVIDSGLREGERVVTEGITKAPDGTLVVPKVEAPSAVSEQPEQSEAQ
ncbi:MAG: efflux RND transporter periplasmic adaptor subunit [Bryobacteraceae bacterium]